MESILYMDDARPAITNCVFKYCSMGSVEEILSSHEIKFNSMNNFNDVYEQEFFLAHYFKDLDSKIQWEEGRKQHTQLDDIANSFFEEMKVSCFSRNAINNLMWSHYGDSHKGVCLCFEFNTLSAPIFEKSMKWGDIIYSSQVPRIEYFEGTTNPNQYRNMLVNVLLTKSIDWAYEEELRFFRQDEEIYHKYNPLSLKAIIIGRKVENEQLEKLENKILELEKGHQPQLIYAYRRASHYNLGLTKDKAIRDTREKDRSRGSMILK